MRLNYSFSSKIALALVVTGGVAFLVTHAFARQGATAGNNLIGLPDDWTHHHVTFSNPGSYGDALKTGSLEKWAKIMNDPRFYLQRMKLSAAASAPTVAEDTTLTTIGAERQAKRPRNRGLWGESLSTSSAAKVGAGMYPAKFAFTGNTLNCATATTPDYVVFNTSQAGVTSGQASIVAYDNLYSSCPTTGGHTVPQTYWAYNTSGTVSMSVVLSGDGSQVAFVQTPSSGNVQFAILKWAASTGTATSSVAPTSQTNSAYRACIAPCMTTISFSGTSVTNTNSPPFYDYVHDIAYVGDNSGKLHKFTGVFSGTPAESGSNGWPVTVSTSTLTGPVYDSTSTLVFVGDSGGVLHSVTTTGSSSQTVVNSTQIGFGNNGIVDAPNVDSSTEKVYAFVACNSSSFGCGLNSNGVFQFPTNFTSSTTPNGALMGTGSSSATVYAGTFDNAYNTGSGNTGNLYVCAYAFSLGSFSNQATLYQIPMSAATFGSTVNTFDNLTSGAASCSPVAEIANGTKDWIFLSVTANGSATGCTGACIYNFNVAGAGTTGTATAGLAASGGTSGMIIDNTAASGGSQIYFSYLSAATSTIKCPSPSGASGGGCAVQASQAALQ